MSDEQNPFWQRVWDRLAGRSSSSPRVASGISAASFDLQYPILTPLKVIYNRISRVSNVKEMYRLFKEVDPVLAGAIDRIAAMVRTSYQGVGVKIGEELESEEEELYEIVKKFEKDFKIKEHFYAIADTILTYGDAVYIAKYKTSVGLSEFRPLPMEYLTAVESKEQMGDSSGQVYEGNIYLLNEMGVGVRGFTDSDKADSLQWKRKEIAHFARSDISSTVDDIIGRFTFGVWSVSPIEPLRPQLLWKLALQINDLVLRQHLVPRQHHKLDLDRFRPELYAGDTIEERMAKAKAAAEAYIATYATTVAVPLKDVDKSIVTGKTTEIGYLEPSKVTYLDPNPLIEQVNQNIYAAFAPVETAVTGRGARTYATELVVASYATLCAESIADIIKTEFLKIIRKHVQTKYKNKYDEHLDKIDIKIRLELEILKGEQVRRLAILSAIPIMTADELRAEVGKEPLTKEQQAKVISRGGQGRAGDFTQSVDDIARDFMKRKEGDQEPVTPQSRSDRQKT